MHAHYFYCVSVFYSDKAICVGKNCRFGISAGRRNWAGRRWLPRQRILDAITPRTRAIPLNTPMNPNGKIFSLDELGFLAGLLDRHDLIANCVEVYEHLTYDGRAHVPLYTLPEAQGHCLRIGSAGKTFSVTGWKVGYVTAPAALLEPVARAQQYLTFATPPHLQAAVAFGLGLEDSYFQGLQATLQHNRDQLATGLRELGFGVLDCGATYFLCVDSGELDRDGDDFAFCRRLVAESGVAAVPISSFYAERDMTSLIRLCFTKRLPLLHQGAACRLAQARRGRLTATVTGGRQSAAAGRRGSAAAGR